MSTILKRYSTIINPISISMSMSIKRYSSTVSIIGAGQMGIGIAYVAAITSCTSKVLLYDTNPTSLDRGLVFLEKLLLSSVKKSRLDPDQAQAALTKVTLISDLENVKDSDFCIEAIVENVQAKTSLFKNLDKVLKKDAILASNTSSISITKIGAATERPQKVIGMHFMNPVPIMKLVEIIPGIQTSQETLQTTLDFVKTLGKTTTLSNDVPGFIANRILMPMLNEACFVLQEGIATKHDIDTTMKLGTNVPMGPLELADFIGLDTCLAIMKVLHTQLGDAKYRPSPLLVKYVDAGWLGKKTGRGFYQY